MPGSTCDAKKPQQNEAVIRTLLPLGMDINFAALTKGVVKGMNKRRRIRWTERRGANILLATRSMVVAGIVHGMPDSLLQKIRTTVRSAIKGQGHGGSATLDMLFSRTKQLDHS